MEFIDEQKFKKNIGIYKITNLINNGIYVGQTKERFQRRFWLHRWELRNGTHNNPHLQKSWNKYEEDNFSFSVVEICEENDIDEKEKYWISYYRDKGKCYNIQDGGQPDSLCSYITPETRKYIGELNRKRMTGCKLSQETREKMSLARKGKRIYRKYDTLTDEQATIIKQMFIKGHTSKEIMEFLKIPYKPINAILSNNSYSTIFVEGWNDFFQKHKEDVRKRKQRSKEIVKLHKEGKPIKEIASLYNMHRRSVEYHIKKQQQST